MRQFAGFGSAADTNARFKFLLEHGQTGLSTAFDFPTLMGYDSRPPAVGGRSRKDGRRDLESRRHGDAVRRHSARPGLDVDDDQRAGRHPVLLLRRGSGKQGVPSTKLRGTVQNDILKEYMAQHAWCYPIEPALRLIVDLLPVGRRARAAVEHGLDLRLPHPRGRSDGGAGARVHARRWLHVRRARDRARPRRRRFAPRLSFFFDIHNDFFEEIAKLRAARRIWARHMRDRYGAKDPRSWCCASIRRPPG